MSLIAFFGALESGLIYGLVALGVLISFRTLDFPDLTADGSFPLGGFKCGRPQKEFSIEQIQHETVVVALAVAEASLDAGTGEEAGKRVRIVIATGAVALQKGHASELGAPDDESFL